MPESLEGYWLGRGCQNDSASTVPVVVTTPVSNGESWLILRQVLHPIGMGPGWETPHLHALDSNIFPILDGLCLQHLWEGTFAFFGNQTVLVHYKRLLCLRTGSTYIYGISKLLRVSHRNLRKLTARSGDLLYYTQSIKLRNTDCCGEMLNKLS